MLAERAGPGYPRGMIKRILGTRLLERLARAEQENATLREHNVALMNRAFVADIQRNGRITVWTFIRGDTTIRIETMGMLSDDTEAWKRKLMGD